MASPRLIPDKIDEEGWFLHETALATDCIYFYCIITRFLSSKDGNDNQNPKF